MEVAQNQTSYFYLRKFGVISAVEFKPAQKELSLLTRYLACIFISKITNCKKLEAISKLDTLLGLEQLSSITHFLIQAGSRRAFLGTLRAFYKTVAKLGFSQVLQALIAVDHAGKVQIYYSFSADIQGK